MSAASASEQPAPAAGPLTAATTGIGSANKASISGLKCALERGPGIVGKAAAAAEIGAARKAAALAGEQKAARASARQASTAWRSSSSVVTLSALDDRGLR